jgi:predicted nucleic acid-binding protein
VPDGRYFFDTSVFLAIIKREPERLQSLELINSLRRNQCVTSVLVAYELYRGVHPDSKTRKSQLRDIELMLSRFSLKPVSEAHAMQGAKAFYKSAGDIDPILGAQCVDGGFLMVTFNLRHFVNIPGIQIHQF